MLAPVATPVPVPRAVVQPTPTPTAAPVPTDTPIPTATPEPTPTLVPTPTRPRVNGYLLSVNGEYVAAGQMVIPVANGEVRVYPMTNPDGGYTRGKTVTLGAYPEAAGSEIAWSGVDTDRDSIATLKMDRDRDVVVVLNSGLALPTVTPIPTAAPVPTPLPVPTAVPVPVATPGPTATPVPPTPTPTPTPVPTLIPLNVERVFPNVSFKKIVKNEKAILQFTVVVF